MSDAAIRFEDVTLGYGRRPAVHHLRGTIPAGSLTAVVGPNGAGKSTLLKGVAGALRPLDGRIEEAIAAVGLTGFERRSIGTLSGGQMQRALFARLLLQDAALILLDEPFTAIDAKTTADLLDLVRRWHAEERTIVAVLHDLDVVKRTFPDTLLIAREPVAWGETGSVLSPENLLRARRMVEAHDPHASACGR